MGSYRPSVTLPPAYAVRPHVKHPTKQSEELLIKVPTPTPAGRWERMNSAGLLLVVPLHAGREGRGSNALTYSFASATRLTATKCISLSDIDHISTEVRNPRPSVSCWARLARLKSRSLSVNAPSALPGFRPPIRIKPPSPRHEAMSGRLLGLSGRTHRSFGRLLSL